LTIRLFRYGNWLATIECDWDSSGGVEHQSVRLIAGYVNPPVLMHQIAAAALTGQRVGVIGDQEWRREES
jgi:hypothetical protein